MSRIDVMDYKKNPEGELKAGCFLGVVYVKDANGVVFCDAFFLGEQEEEAKQFLLDFTRAALGVT